MSKEVGRWEAILITTSSIPCWIPGDAQLIGEFQAEMEVESIKSRRQSSQRQQQNFDSNHERE
jgi:hypothetical protein